jgi:hypothetical protein
MFDMSVTALTSHISNGYARHVRDGAHDPAGKIAVEVIAILKGARHVLREMNIPVLDLAVSRRVLGRVLARADSEH